MRSRPTSLPIATPVSAIGVTPRSRPLCRRARTLRATTSPPSKASGIGDWSDAEIKRAITQGVRKDGTKLKPPMGYGFYAKMTDGDVDAMVAYLRTVPPKE
jgi:hypothetical protein